VLCFVPPSHALLAPPFAKARDTRSPPAHDRVNLLVAVAHVERRRRETLPRLEGLPMGARNSRVGSTARGVITDQEPTCNGWTS
jgi:hypothetical protein